MICSNIKKLLVQVHMTPNNNSNKVPEQLLLDLRIVFTKLIPFLDLVNIKKCFIKPKVLVSLGNESIGKPIKAVQVLQLIQLNNFFLHQKQLFQEQFININWTIR